MFSSYSSESFGWLALEGNDDKRWNGGIGSKALGPLLVEVADAKNELVTIESVDALHRHVIVGARADCNLLWRGGWVQRKGAAGHALGEGRLDLVARELH